MSWQAVGMWRTVQMSGFRLDLPAASPWLQLAVRRPDAPRSATGRRWRAW